ncbi:MAG: FAD-dependent oxidoreductase, partial [Planctomycetota bacterium]
MPGIDTIDAAVIGGGPAGALAALGLAQRGWRVTLIERGRADRDRCCGWCLSPRVGPTLDRLGVRGVVDRAAVARTTGVRVRPAPGAGIDLPFESGLGWLTPRRALDSALRGAAHDAGAEIITGARAVVRPGGSDRFRVAVERGGDGFDLRPALIVGADGLGSAVARATRLSRPVPRRRRAYGFSFEVDGQPHPLPIGRVEMLLTAIGYLGVVAHPGGAHAAALVRPAGDGAAVGPGRFLDRVFADHPEARAWLGAGAAARRPIAAGPMPWRAGPPARAGVALVGDAAGYVEPFTGEGMA